MKQPGDGVIVVGFDVNATFGGVLSHHPPYPPPLLTPCFAFAGGAELPAGRGTAPVRCAARGWWRQLHGLVS